MAGPAKDDPTLDRAREGLLARVREVVTDAIRYWEPRRVVYNAVLALTFLGHLAPAWRRVLREDFRVDGVLILFLLAVGANICFSAAYVVDVFVQLSALRATWVRLRVVLFLVGTAVAAILTRFVALGVLAP